MVSSNETLCSCVSTQAGMAQGTVLLFQRVIVSPVPIDGSTNTSITSTCRKCALQYWKHYANATTWKAAYISVVKHMPVIHGHIYNALDDSFIDVALHYLGTKCSKWAVLKLWLACIFTWRIDAWECMGKTDLSDAYCFLVLWTGMRVPVRLCGA